MIRRRQRKVQKGHYALLVNKQAANYSERAVAKLIAAIRGNEMSYTVYEPSSAVDLLKQAEVAAGLRQATPTHPRPWERGGPVTGLVACGGDGTFNLVARAAHKAGLPVGHYPLGKMNNMALSYYGTSDPGSAIKNLLSAKVRAVDAALAENIPFFGSIGLGFAPQFLKELGDRSLPRLSLGWSQLGGRVAAGVETVRTIVKVDSFRFEIRPIILNINIVSHSLGLPLTPSSVPDDGQVEMVFDAEQAPGNFAGFTRLIKKGKYLYGDAFRLFRGREISVEPVAGRTLYLDGELIELPTDMLEVRIENEKLQVLC
jgi:diacylglycerol kinase family enzyme